MYFQAQSEIDT